MTEADLAPREEVEGSETRSEDSLPIVDSSSSSVNEDEGSVADSNKSSPKRKQSHPQQSLDRREEEEEAEQENPNPREEVLRNNIEYNTLTHGYDCRQCEFSSADHAATRDHVNLDHLRESAELQCKECMITFTKPFNLQIHNRKHETSSQFLPCEYCEQVFKVPNKLIKHMEGVHCVCPACGAKHEDKAGLQHHMEQAHNEGGRRGIHVNIQHLSNLSSLLPAKHRFDIDSRHAKMRKLDTLAEHIRAKQLQNANGTNTINRNEKHVAPPEPIFRRTLKADHHPMIRNLEKHEEMHNHHHHYSKPGLESLVSQLNRVHHHNPLMKSENNNILSSLSKMSAELPERRLYPQEEEYTPPCSPPCSPPTSDARITSNVILINNNPTCESDDSNETGLDLTLKKERREEEEEEVVSTTDHRPTDYYRGRIITPSFPYIVPSLPFLTRMPMSSLQHHNSSFTEHLFKLASISRPPSHPSAPQDLSKPGNPASGHHTVLSAMLGHRPPVPPPVFPVFGGALPASMFPQHPLPPPRSEENSSSPVPSLGKL